MDADCERHRNLYRMDEPVLERKHPAGPGTASNILYRFSVLAQSSTECRCWTTSDSLVQHPADRDKRLHDPRLPSARSKQSARACCPTSVLSVAPPQTHSRDPQLPGTPLRSRDRRPRGARCCGHTNSREGVLRSRHARGWSTRSCVLVLCSLVPW